MGSVVHSTMAIERSGALSFDCATRLWRLARLAA